MLVHQPHDSEASKDPYDVPQQAWPGGDRIKTNAGAKSNYFRLDGHSPQQPGQDGPPLGGSLEGSGRVQHQPGGPCGRGQGGLQVLQSTTY